MKTVLDISVDKGVWMAFQSEIRDLGNTYLFACIFV